VLFGKPPKKNDDRTLVEASKEAIHPSDDYYTPLFIQGFTRSSSWMQPLEKLLFHANKTVDTSDANLAIQDHQACKLLHRVYHLQNSDKWSLRQPKRCPEPVRQPGHWDVVVQEIKWMRTDFREERKWRTAIAGKLAQACADWVAATPEERKEMQVAAYIPPKPIHDGAMDGNATEAADESIPELIPGDAASPQASDELVEVFPETVSPSQIFTLTEDDLVFGLRMTPAAFQLLDELPLYGPPLKAPQVDPIAPEIDSDAHWRRPALPLSRYVEGPMKLVTDKVPKAQSGFEYSDEESSESEDDGEAESKAILPPPTDGSRCSGQR
jgi:chromatin modification-related protein VID21